MNDPQPENASLSLPDMRLLQTGVRLTSGHLPLWAQFTAPISRTGIGPPLALTPVMSSSEPDPRLVRLALLAIPSAFFALIYATSFTAGYGYFIDEFYYLACAARPDFGYVDHPPLAPWALTAFASVFGTSVAAIRVLPAAAGAVTVFLSGRLARRLPGSGPLAEALAALAMACIPVLWSLSSFYSMNAFEPLLGVLNKHTFVLIVAALFLGLLLAGHARNLASRGAVLAAVTGSLLALPNLLWQWANGFPSLEFYRIISAQKNIHTPPLDFLANQLMSMNCWVVGLAVAGSLAAVRAARLREYRFLGFAFLVGFAFFLCTGSSRVDRLLFVYCWAIPLGAWCVAQLPAPGWRILVFTALGTGILKSSPANAPPCPS